MLTCEIIDVLLCDLNYFACQHNYLDTDINKSHVNMIKSHVDKINPACRGQKFANIEV